jgi:hypothetical protein
MLSALRRSRIFQFVLIVGLLAILLFVGSFFTPFHGEIFTKNEYANQKDCASYHIALVFLWQVAKALNDYGSALTAVATALLAVITGWLVLVARDQSNTTRAQLRAYVLVSGAGIMDINNRVGRKAQITIRNFGQTPAHDLKFWAAVGLHEFPLQRALSQPPHELRMGADVLAPGRDSTMVIPVESANDGQENCLRRGQAAIYVFGHLAYIDAFNIERQTDFRLMCYGDGFAEGLISPCEEGNKYT